VRFYNDFDVNLATSSALVAITSGTFASPNDEAAEETDIANYRPCQLDDRFYARWIAMGAEAKRSIGWRPRRVTAATGIAAATSTSTWP
jgi:hypothetical protein